ncbi:MAG: sensor domain-containing phosphodiesterase [Pseudomonadota bacterium]
MTPQGAAACDLPAVEALTHEVEAGRVEGRFQGHRLTSHFQPIISLTHQRPVGYEALLRVQDATGAPLSPLVPFAHCAHVGQTVLLDRLSRYLHVRNFLSQGGAESAWLFLNVHPLTIAHGKGHGPYFAHLLERYGIAPSRIVIEILEAQIQDETALVRAVDYYKDLGCLVAIDDFGTGHSNFSRVWDIRPEIVKLDRSLVVRAAHDKRVRRLLPNLMAMINESGGLTLMEGIEREDEAMIALETGVDLVQGYLFGRPGPLRPGHDGAQQALITQLAAQMHTLSALERQRLGGLLEPYRLAFNQAAARLRAGQGLEQAVAELLRLPRAERCYLLNHEGRQIGGNIEAPHTLHAFDHRFAPVLDAAGAQWNQRYYFRRAMAQPGELQLSRPYRSIIGGNQCVTLSLAFEAGPAGRYQVFCADVDWSET